MEAYTIAYITVKDAKELETYNKDYQDMIDEVSDKIEKISEERRQARYQEIVDEAKEKLDSAQNEYDTQKKQAEDEITQAQKQLEDAKNKVESGKAELEKSKKSSRSEFEKAEKHLSDAILFNEIAGNAKNRFLIDMSQAHMLWKMGNEDEVRDHVDELVEGAINNINSANYVLEILSLCNLFMNMGEFDAWKKVIVEYERFAIETENLFFQKTCVKMWMKYESAMGDTEAYNKLCVYYANLHSMQVKEQIKRLGDTIDLKLQLQETEYERRKAVRLNYTDMLTGMGNKFKMRNDFEKLVGKNQDSDGAGITFGVVDIDFFKSFNRNSGRVTGDAVLKELSSIINESIKDKGMGYHFYGDEFYIILQETDEDIIKNIAEHIRLELAKKQILHESSKVDEYLTVSQAYVTAPDVKVPDEFSRLFKTVDEVLNDVKEKGRNAYKIV